MTDPMDTIREKLELIREGSLNSNVLASEALTILDSLEPCFWCDGKGETRYTVSDPNCGNCQYGDCDYGHEKVEVCSHCDGTGRKS